MTRETMKKLIISKNKCFFIALCFGVLLSILQSIYIFKLYSINVGMTNITDNTRYNPHIQMNTVYSWWIGNKIACSYSDIFFFVSPLLSAVSAFRYYKVKTDKPCELSASHLSKELIFVFILSGTSIGLPMLLNFLTTLAIVPALPPDSIYDIYYGVFSTTLFGGIFYSFPILYIVLFIAINFLFYGLFGCFCYCISYLFKNRIISVLLPCSGLLLLEFCKSFCYEIIGFDISPVTILHPLKAQSVSEYIVLIEIGLLMIAVLSFLLLIKTHSKKVEDKR